MTTSPSSLIGELNGSEQVWESIYPHEHDLNMAEGGEFLDDAIRMKDQPLEEVHKNEKE